MWPAGISGEIPDGIGALIGELAGEGFGDVGAIGHDGGEEAGEDSDEDEAGDDEDFGLPIEAEEADFDTCSSFDDGASEFGEGVSDEPAKDTSADGDEDGLTKDDKENAIAASAEGAHDGDIAGSFVHGVVDTDKDADRADDADEDGEKEESPLGGLEKDVEHTGDFTDGGGGLGEGALIDLALESDAGEAGGFQEDGGDFALVDGEGAFLGLGEFLVGFIDGGGADFHTGNGIAKRGDMSVEKVEAFDIDEGNTIVGGAGRIEDADNFEAVGVGLPFRTVSWIDRVTNLVAEFGGDDGTEDSFEEAILFRAVDDIASLAEGVVLRIPFSVFEGGQILWRGSDDAVGSQIVA